MKSINDLVSMMKSPNKICDPLLLYIIMGFFKFFILFSIYKEFTKEGFAPVDFSNNDNEECSKCNKDYSKCDKDDPLCPHCKKDLKLSLVIAINFMFYLYVIFGMFLHLLCKNNMEKAAWFVILYPFLSKFVWMLII